MAKSKVVSKKLVAPLVAPIAPVQAEAPAPVAAKAKTEKVAKEKPVKVPETQEVKWARRLGRWATKATAAGCDVKALMTKALAA
jgi:hypothetical protein